MRRILFSVICVGLVSCATSNPGPQEKTDTKFAVRPYQIESLKNGLKLIIVKDDSLPRFRLSLMNEVGSAHDSPNEAGAQCLMMNLLEESTLNKSSVKISEEYNFYGSEFNANCGSDFSAATVSGLSIHSMKLIKLFAESVLQPAFNEKDFNRRRSEAVAQIQQLQDNPGGMADHLAEKVFFGAHPYGRLSVGSPETLKALTPASVRAHYQKFFVPQISSLSISGRIDEETLKQVRTIFGEWNGAAIDNKVTPVRPEQQSSRYILFSKKDLRQTQVRMIHPGIRRSDADFLKYRLANMVLGGAFASRLNQKVRDDLGLTYSIGSSFESRKEQGLFEISTFTRNDKVFDVINESRQVFKNFVEKGITEKELQAAKNLLIGQFPSIVETSDAVATNLQSLKVYGVEATYLETYRDQVAKTTREEVNKLIRRHFDLDDTYWVIYADQNEVRSGLEKLGAFEVRAIE